MSPLKSILTIAVLCASVNADFFGPYVPNLYQPAYYPVAVPGVFPGPLAVPVVGAFQPNYLSPVDVFTQSALNLINTSPALLNAYEVWTLDPVNSFSNVIQNVFGSVLTPSADITNQIQLALQQVPDSLTGVNHAEAGLRAVGQHLLNEGILTSENSNYLAQSYFDSLNQAALGLVNPTSDVALEALTSGFANFLYPLGVLTPDLVDVAPLYINELQELNPTFY